MGVAKCMPYKSLKDFNSETIVCGSLLGNKYFNIFSAFANLDSPFVPSSQGCVSNCYSCQM